MRFLFLFAALISLSACLKGGDAEVHGDGDASGGDASIGDISPEVNVDGI